jgi:succinate dehydrogenase hydrophobic anchor subunit
MNESLYGPKTGEGAWLWFIKALTGVLVIVILFIHFIVNHFVAPNGLLTYAEVLRYYQNPIIPIMEILFVAFVVSHALIGLRGIILDLNPSRAFLRVINWVFGVVGAAAIVYGVWLILTLVAKGSSS